MMVRLPPTISQRFQLLLAPRKLKVIFCVTNFFLLLLASGDQLPVTSVQ
jgi:hypothetical protein